MLFPDCVSQSAVIVKGFIYHVPPRYFTFEMRHNSLDMILHQMVPFQGGACKIKDPCRQLLMPDKRVSMKPLSVCSAKIC